MTTIVADARIGLMGSDTYCSSGYHCSKLFRHKTKGIFGCAGDDTAIARFEDWILRKGKRPDQIGSTEDFEALQLCNGKLYIWGAAMRSELILASYHAIGSGGAYALGSLAHGATVEQALRIAETLDGGTKGPMDYMREVT